MKLFRKLFLLLTFAFILTSCDSTDPWEFVPPDFSSVPGRYDISGVEPSEIDAGVTAYILDRDEDHPFFVDIRDFIQAEITLRTEEGDIIFSSFANDRSQPINLSVRDLGIVMPYQGRQVYHQDLLNTPGLQAGILGMMENERRTLIVAPEQGYKDAQTTLPNEQYRDQTLIYDIYIHRIDPS